MTIQFQNVWRPAKINVHWGLAQTPKNIGCPIVAFSTFLAVTKSSVLLVNRTIISNSVFLCLGSDISKVAQETDCARPYSVKAKHILNSDLHRCFRIAKRGK